MHAVVHGERTLTDLDFARLTKLLSQQLPPTLADLLASAEVTSSRAVNADVVTMYSRVEVVDVHTRRRQVLTICYPGDAEPAAGFISVLSPVGNSLLGLKTGDVARWLTPTGEECAAEIAAIQYQPEATGDYSR
ncbi:GreA/GreB family elongation factor [Variovorax ginsengisoli]|uniref:GreA/GreB family elongation factor n=1 Tax=Variovorax ginsengisoli TaxID=363844 RepID=A0ABT8SGQ7_9BURK|nr:GreA/GreB family elongation factor [Variovorax ginsengisoli]MDN8617491.1 GreA/GreB family elongation factor [Variovorax ginsengisoli]MDO1536661.1 GreA/GreB family elongation factor [Variovorax ginsengisoli]